MLADASPVSSAEQLRTLNVREIGMSLGDIVGTSRGNIVGISRGNSVRMSRGDILGAILSLVVARAGQHNATADLEASAVSPRRRLDLVGPSRVPSGPD